MLHLYVNIMSAAAAHVPPQPARQRPASRIRIAHKERVRSTVNAQPVQPRRCSGSSQRRGSSSRRRRETRPPRGRSSPPPRRSTQRCKVRSARHRTKRTLNSGRNSLRSQDLSTRRCPFPKLSSLLDRRRLRLFHPLAAVKSGRRGSRPFVPVERYEAAVPALKDALERESAEVPAPAGSVRERSQR